MADRDGGSVLPTQTRARKAKWTYELHKMFVDLCVEQTLIGNKPGTQFTRYPWRYLADCFEKKAGVKFDRQQVKRHWVSTKEQWKAWRKLIDRGNLKYHPETGRIDAHELKRFYCIEVLRIPGAASFWKKGLPFADKLNIIFDGLPVTEETEPPSQHRKYNSVARLEKPGDGIAVKVECPTQRRNYNDSPYHLHVKEPVVNIKPDYRAKRVPDAVESRNTMMDSSPEKINYTIGELPSQHRNYSQYYHTMKEPAVNIKPYNRAKHVPDAVEARNTTMDSSREKLNYTVAECPSQRRNYNDTMKEPVVNIKPDKRARRARDAVYSTMMNSSSKNLNYNIGECPGQRRNCNDTMKEPVVNIKPDNRTNRARDAVYSTMMDSYRKKLNYTIGEYPGQCRNYNDTMKEPVVNIKPDNRTKRARDAVESRNTMMDSSPEKLNYRIGECPSQHRNYNDTVKEPVVNIKPDNRAEHVSDAVGSRNTVMDSSPVKLNYTIGECIECLDRMQELQQGSELYLFALEIFLKKEYREIFLHLKKSSVRIAWLQRLQSAAST